MSKLGRWIAGAALGLGVALAPAVVFFATLAFATSSSAQLRVEADPLHRLGGPPLAWASVIDVDATDSLLVVAASPEPFLHLFRLADGELRWQRRWAGRVPGSAH